MKLLLFGSTYSSQVFPGGSAVKNPLSMQETWGWSLGQEDPLEKEMATHSRILAWKIPRTEETRGQQSTGSQRVWHNWACTLTFTGMHNEWYSHFGRQFGSFGVFWFFFFTKLNIFLTYNPASMLLGIYPKEAKKLSTQKPAYRYL